MRKAITALEMSSNDHAVPPRLRRQAEIALHNLRVLQRKKLREAALAAGDHDLAAQYAALPWGCVVDDGPQ